MWLSVNSYTHTKTLIMSYLKYVTLGNWTCDAQQFDCGQSHPKCVSVAQVCNDHQDCSDGTDEDPKLCGMI